MKREKDFSLGREVVGVFFCSFFLRSDFCVLISVFQKREKEAIR